MGNHYQRFDTAVYNKHFNQEKSDWLQANYNKFSDRAAAVRLGIPKRIVTGYRTDVLKAIKQRHKKPDLNFRNCKTLAMQELEALEAYQYEGIMIDSVKHRIQHLRNIINFFE